MTSSDDDTIAAETPTSVTTAASDPGPAHLRPGDRFAERYEIEALLGRGGMGAVYRVRDQKLDEVVALKLLTLDNAHAQDRFVSEVRLARRITHPNIARVHDFGEQGDVRFLTMEYIAGTTLEQVVETRAPLPMWEVVRLGLQITAGLIAAHTAGVIHRDLKPANVLVGPDDRVVITDFGIARAINRGTDTVPGAMLGTPHYMAPEQVLGRTAEARSDLYALGVLMYELATGTLPFDSDTALGAALARVQVCPIDPRTHHPIDDPLAALILHCLAREPEGRPDSASALQQSLRALVGEAPALVEPSPPRPTDTGSHPFAPIAVGSQSVAVLPFAYRGPADQDYLGDAMAEELIDVLSHTRGLRVLALGATRRFADQRDPSAIAAAVDADAIVDGTVQQAGRRVRLSVRMIDPDGTQRWTERYDGELQDVFELQETLGRRVAEALRVELVAAAHRCTAPPEALEVYFQARRLQRRLPMLAADEAVELLDRALELAPDFSPAMAFHAVASVRAWWGYEYKRQDGVFAERARRSVTRAQEQASAIAETHLATAMWEVQSGGFVAGARALSTALETAPTLPEAHQYLGQLQCEAGRPKEGRKRLELALELDPTLHFCRYTLARITCLDGEFERSREHLDLLWDALPGPPVPALVSRFRLALYRGDETEAQRMRALMKDNPAAESQSMHTLSGLATGETSVETAMSLHQSVQAAMTNARFGTLMRQIATEMLTVGGATQLALRELSIAADSALIDLVWLERCPLLEPLRSEPAFARAVHAVERRVAAIWH